MPAHAQDATSRAPDAAETPVAIAQAEADAPRDATEERLRALESTVSALQANNDRQQERIVELEASAARAAEDREAAQLSAALPDDVDVSEYLAPELLDIYGYLDIGLQGILVSDEALLAGFFPTRASTFVLGNVNLYVDVNPSVDWGGLFEIRFTNLPHGNETSFGDPTGNTYARTDTSLRDLTSPDGRNNVVLGSVLIERAWIEWHKFSFFKIRAGLWLTPYGIWNVDHGTPVQISLIQPGFIVDQAFPQRQLGVQVLGDAPLGDGWNLGYSAYVSNGRTPSQFDFSGDKALGGRVYARYWGAVRTTLGVSAYVGSYQDITKDIASFAPFRVDTSVTVAFDEWGIGADVSLDAGRFKLRTEGILRRQDFEPGKHAPVVLGPPGSTAPSAYYSSGYVLLAYDLPWGGLEPYVYQELTHRPASTGDTSLITGIGTNVHFTPSVQLKLMGGFVHFADLSAPDTRQPGMQDFAILASRLVLTF